MTCTCYIWSSRTNTCRLPFKGQCLCQCAGTAGLWYVSGPRPETHKDRTATATGCEEGVVRLFSFSHRPWDAYRTYNTHSCLGASCTWLYYFSPTQENVPKMPTELVKTHAFLLMPFSTNSHSFINTTTHPVSFPTSPHPYAEVNELVLNSFTSWQELHSKPWK